jgi:glucose-6-phosphate 1-dehydrogenase
MTEAFDVQGRGAFYEDVGAVRDVLQNHLLQILALLAMDRPAADDGAAIDRAKVEVLKAIHPLAPADIVRGQYRGYRAATGVSPDSRTETFAAVRLQIDNPRWAGVTFRIRTGKCLAATATEVRIRLKPPAHGLFDSEAGGRPNEFRFRLSPDVFLALTALAKVPGEAMIGEEVRLVESHRAGDAMDPYDRLLGDALSGDHTLFGSQAGVEAAWRIVDPILVHDDPVLEYECGSEGPDSFLRLPGASVLFPGFQRGARRKPPS